MIGNEKNRLRFCNIDSRKYKVQRYSLSCLSNSQKSVTTTTSATKNGQPGAAHSAAKNGQAAAVRHQVVDAHVETFGASATKNVI
jgi:hypothetical protein